MSRNGSGVYSLAAGNPVTTGTTISSSWANNTLTDIASALTASIASDGQTVITANLPMSTYAHTGVGVATARTMYGTAGQIQDNTLTYLTTIAGTNVITAVAPVLMSAYATGQTFYFLAAGGNTGAVTVNINAIGAKAVKKTDGSALISGDILTGAAVQIMYDGTNFQLLSDSNGTNETVGNLTVTGTTTATGLITANGGVSGALNGSLGATTPSTVVATTVNASGAVIATSTTTNSYFSSVSTNNGSGGSYRVTSNTAGGVANTWYIGTNFTTNTNTFEIYDVALADKLFWSLPNTGNVTINKSIGVGAATPSASGAGITFPATQSASTDANTLDDYEEGTWTPTYTTWTVIGTGSSNGRYIKIGKQVTVFGYIAATTSVAAVAGFPNGKIGGLPFTSGSAINLAGNGIGTNASLLASSVIFVAPADTVGFLTTAVAATTEFDFTFIYYVN